MSTDKAKTQVETRPVDIAVPADGVDIAVPADGVDIAVPADGVDIVVTLVAMGKDGYWTYAQTVPDPSFWQQHGVTLQPSDVTRHFEPMVSCLRQKMAEHLTGVGLIDPYEPR